MRSKSGWLIPAAIVLAAFAVRLIMLLQTRNLPIYYQPLLDARFFHQWAEFKRTFAWAEATPAFREPIYAYFVALVYSVFRDSLTIVRVIQCLLGSASVLLLYAATRHIYGKLAATVAAVVLAFFSPAIFFASEINETTLAVFLVIASAYVLTSAGKGRPLFNTGLSGLLAGAAFLTRFVSVMALPAWILHLLLSREPRLRKATVTLIVGFAIVPLCYHVLLVKTDQRAYLPLRASWHALMGSGAVGGFTLEPKFEIGLGGSRGAYRAMASTGRIEGLRDLLRFARIDNPEAESEVDAYRHWGDRVAEDLASNPRGYSGVFMKKLGVFWGPTNPPSNLDMRYVADFSFLLKNRLLSFAVVAALGLLGLVAGLRRNSLGFALYTLCLPLLASVYLISDIEKMLVMPFLAMFTGVSVAAVARSIKTRKMMKAIGLIVAGGILIAVFYQLPGRELDRARSLVVTGDAYAQVGIFDRAESLYEEAIGLSPGLADASISLARLYGRAGKAAHALEVLDRAMLESQDPQLHIERTELLLLAGRQDEAMAGLRSLEESYPYEARLHQMIGHILLRRNRFEEAAEELQKELDHVGRDFVTLSLMGEASFGLGDYSLAAASLEEAIALNPYSVPVATRLADTYSRMGQDLRACDVLSRILTVDRGNIPLRFKLGVCLYKADRPRDALMHFKELLKFDPANADIALNMGVAYAAMDSIDKAIEMWEQALTIDPENEIARDNLRTIRE
jgi:tetratricopeptide (TPR) repeat protein/4-amino-4-deoxy-L-arabinose transferase-like glycosyltransferase